MTSDITAASKDAGAYGSACASPTAQRTAPLPSLPTALAIIPGARSSPKTLAPSPLASGMAKRPVPHPRSSTASPGRMPPRATRRPSQKRSSAGAKAR